MVLNFFVKMIFKNLRRQPAKIFQRQFLRPSGWAKAHLLQRSRGLILGKA